MQFIRALRLTKPFPFPDSVTGKRGEGAIAFVGAGGKTTALFLLARQLLQSGPAPTILLTATSHLAVAQTSLADHHLIAETPEQIHHIPSGLTLVTGPIQGDRTMPVSPHLLAWLHEHSHTNSLPLLIEADGSRRLPLKAPADHEPPIPHFARTVIVVAGLNGLGAPLTDEFVFRAGQFQQLSQPAGDTVTPDMLARVLSHPLGGLKNIPPDARRIALLNQAETPELQAAGGRIARALLPSFDSVLVGSLRDDAFQTIERTAVIILAAGTSTRFGEPKQLLDWNGQPFVRRVAQTALQADLGPVTVVVGHRAPQVESALAGLPVTIIHNPDYAQGQSTSIRAGLSQFFSSPEFGGGIRGEGAIGSAIFLLADQPQMPVEILRALAERHAQNLPAILAPLVLEERRANPVLFDRVTFPHLLALQGDVGGRAIFDKHKVEYLPWHDDILLFDVDSPQDYERLKNRTPSTP